MTEYIEDLYPVALQCGIGPLLFWDYSLGEVVDLIDAYTNNKKQDMKMQAVMLEVQAQQIAERFSIDENIKVHKLWDYYPWLFAEEQQLAEKTHEDMELEKLKSRRKQFAAEHNKRYGGGS